MELKKLLILIPFLFIVSSVFALCGDSYCNITIEDQESCCVDCGCPFYHRCTNNVCVETTSDVAGGLGEEVGKGLSQAVIPLSGILLFGGIIVILIASIIGGIKDNNRR